VTLQSAVDTYGYVAILIGTFFEGETILVLGGFAAHQGYLALPWVIASAFAGSLCGDQLFFYLGRRHSQAVLAKRPLWKSRIGRVTGILERFRRSFMLGFRFVYGIRTITPFAIGMSHIRAGEFFLYNAAGALLWAAAVGSGGYLVGNALVLFLGNVKRYEKEALAAIVVFGLLVWGIHFLRQRR
jgi:membrane protein DedA with SNARE-associated domain